MTRWLLMRTVMPCGCGRRGEIALGIGPARTIFCRVCWRDFTKQAAALLGHGRDS